VQGAERDERRAGEPHRHSQSGASKMLANEQYRERTGSPAGRSHPWSPIPPALTHSSLFGTLPSTQTQLVPSTQPVLVCNLEFVLSEGDSVCDRLIPTLPKVTEHVGTRKAWKPSCPGPSYFTWASKVWLPHGRKARWMSSPRLTLLLQQMGFCPHLMHPELCSFSLPSPYFSPQFPRTT